jgi:hypothetical protein
MSDVDALKAAVERVRADTLREAMRIVHRATPAADTPLTFDGARTRIRGLIEAEYNRAALARPAAAGGPAAQTDGLRNPYFAWDEGFTAAHTMARLWGHVDYWEDYPENPYAADLGEPVPGNDHG